MQKYSYLKNAAYAVEESWGFWEVKSNEELERATHVTIPVNDYRSLLDHLSLLDDQSDYYKEQIKEKEEKIIGLERIMRERSNQRRGLAPKKAFDGYLVLQTLQTEDVFRYAMSSEEYDSQSDSFRATHEFIENEEPVVHAKILVWKTTIQTPINATMPSDTAEKMIYEALTTNVLSDTVCDYFNEFTENGECAGFVDPETGEVVCRLYKWRLRANYRTNLWEVDVFTTKALNIPEYRKPMSYKKGA